MNLPALLNARYTQNYRIGRIPKYPISRKEATAHAFSKSSRARETFGTSFLAGHKRSRSPSKDKLSTPKKHGAIWRKSSLSTALLQPTYIHASPRWEYQHFCLKKLKI